MFCILSRVSSFKLPQHPVTKSYYKTHSKTQAWVAEQAHAISWCLRTRSHPQSINPASDRPNWEPSSQQHVALPVEFRVFRSEGQGAVERTLILVFSFLHQVSLPLRWKKIFYSLFLCMNNNCTSLILSKKRRKKKTKWKMFNSMHRGSLWKFFYGTGSSAILTQTENWVFAQYSNFLKLTEKSKCSQKQHSTMNPLRLSIATIISSWHSPFIYTQYPCSHAILKHNQDTTLPS